MTTSDDALPEPVAKIHSDGYWTAGKSFKEPLNFARMEVYTADQMRAAIARERAQADALRTVMIAAAEEIAAHWADHCDAEGYGPQNLMRRLEEGIPSEYGYTAGRFAELQAELATLRQQLAEAAQNERERIAWMDSGRRHRRSKGAGMSDTMLFGVLRMPYELAMSTELSRRQFHDRAQQACDALEAMQADAERYRWLRSDPTFLGHGVEQSAAEIDSAIDAAMQVSGAADPVGLPAGEQTRPSTAAPTLTEYRRMQIIGEEFPLALVEPIVIRKIDAVCRAIERAVREQG